MNKLKDTFKNKKVIVTGHTGFKGSWLTLWLLKLGANVVGISNGHPTKPSHFRELSIKNKIRNYWVDVRNLKKTRNVFIKEKPDFVFHLAAQAIVKKSFKNPIYNWETNTIGTINVMESLRYSKKKCTAIMITSDKSYKNLEIKRGYKENDLLGGYDPYSASKSAAEFAIQSYVKSFFSKKNKILIGVARAGNVIGGGDWSDNRLIPDCVKSWSKKKIVNLRNPASTRPWQHVLEALHGYLIFAKALEKNKKLHGQAFNFGPPNSNDYKVISVVKGMKIYWNKVSWRVNNSKKFSESGLLKLNSNKAKKILKWKNYLDFKKTVKFVGEWYNDYYTKSKNSYIISNKQIDIYEKYLN